MLRLFLRQQINWKTVAFWLIVPMILVAVFCGVLVSGEREGIAGFSDNLTGKGKPPGSQQGAKDAPVEKVPAPVETPVQPPAPARAAAGVLLGKFDIVGLKLGMTQEEAIQAVQRRTRELNGKPITFEIVKEAPHQVLVQGTAPRTKSVTLSDAKSVLKAFDLSEEPARNPAYAQDPRAQQFVLSGQIETFGFQFPNVPNEARISSITRVQRLAPPVHPETIRAALIQKYGPPSIDDKVAMVWLIDTSGAPPATQDFARCRGIVLPPGAQAGDSDYSLLAIKGCGEQLTVQLHGTSEAVMLIQTSLYHHQRLVDEREATQKAAMSRLGLTPEQTKQAPAPQF